MIRGKIVLVPFPFDDLSTTKVRPAVCLTERIGPHDHYLARLGHLLHSEVGTQIRHRPPPRKPHAVAPEHFWPLLLMLIQSQLRFVK